MNIFNILNNDIEGLSEEEKSVAESLNEAIREKIIDELAEYEVDLLIEEMKNDIESFREKMESIFVSGKKGYNKIPTKALIDIYLDKKNEGDFINLIEEIVQM